MELRHLRYFVTVAEELNFSKAAQKLFTAQPSLSQQIKCLEDELGFHLFHRTKRKVELTQEGKYLLPYAYATLEQVEKAIDKTRLAAKAQKNVLRIGFVPVAESKVFPYLLPMLRFENPDLKLSLQSMDAIEQYHALENGELDIAIIREKIATSAISNHLILKEKMIFLLPEQHALSKAEQITLEMLNHISLIIPSETHAPTLHSTIRNFFHTHHIQINYIQHAANILFNINSVSMGLGCAILPDYVRPIVKNNKSIVVRELTTELPLLDLYACYNKRNNQMNIAKFMDELKKRSPF
ncbi:LysR substrate-binding domain-containing protein [Acinetobacter puyangensis]|uniref:LysR substrate-binding domain-containing protein n=1 Tax=Acinetobacter puyangensis TaxID=1096779 RepID=UPI003A4E10AD